MIKRLAMGVVIFLIATSPVFAKHHHRQYHYYKATYHNFGYPAAHIVSHPSGCPRTQFCGCGASVKLFGKPIRSLYLAANWFKFPRANPGPGMAAVRNHHVMVILAYDGNGNATVYDPNSGGHQTRIHTRSLAGYRIVNPNG